jgi:glycine cleavage system aminomethyltransferase T
MHIATSERRLRIVSVAEPLEATLARAGAVMVGRDGRSVAAHYGSPAGELAVCLQSVGIADRSTLGKILVTGAPAALGGLVSRITGVSLSPTGLTRAGAASWCMRPSGEVMIIVEPAQHRRLRELVRTDARPLTAVVVDDISSSHAAIALLGPRTDRVLAEIGALRPGDCLRDARPCSIAAIAGASVTVLLESDRSALLVTDAESANRIWLALEDAGRGVGLSCVGTQAVERFLLAERMRHRAPHVL